MQSIYSFNEVSFCLKRKKKRWKRGWHYWQKRPMFKYVLFFKIFAFQLPWTLAHSSCQPFVSVCDLWAGKSLPCKNLSSTGASEEPCFLSLFSAVAHKRNLFSWVYHVRKNVVILIKSRMGGSKIILTKSLLNILIYQFTYICKNISKM